VTGNGRALEIVGSATAAIDPAVVYGRERAAALLLIPEASLTVTRIVSRCGCREKRLFRALDASMKDHRLAGFFKCKHIWLFMGAVGQAIGSNLDLAELNNKCLAI
jgi:hypothetical protein